MKPNKILTVFSVFIMVSVLLCSCSSGSADSGVSQTTAAQTAAPAAAGTGEVDVDLTSLSSTMVYSEVYNMMVSPESYLGKTVKMNGAFAVYEDEETGKIYYACVIADATACCSQGIEFVLGGNYSYPADYPELGTEITVTGEFGTYVEGGITYCQLTGAEMQA